MPLVNFFLNLTVCERKNERGQWRKEGGKRKEKERVEREEGAGIEGGEWEERKERKEERQKEERKVIHEGTR